MNKKWTIADIPALEGCTVIVTGAGGLGFQDALALARAGADVIIAGRSPEKGQAAVEKIHQEIPDARVRFEVLDLANLQSIADFGGRIKSQLTGLDILINNAGVMTPPKRKVTADGFELQFGTNYLGHYALTGHLLPLLKQAKGRVISLSSIAARRGAINFDDLQAERGYTPMPVYAQSKLACLMFAFELQRRSDAADWGITSIAAHPGLSRTELFENSRGLTSPSARIRQLVLRTFQTSAQGALPTLFAATSSEARGGAYYGPSGFYEIRGYPALAKNPSRSLDLAVAAKLWDISADLTKVTLR